MVRSIRIPAAILGLTAVALLASFAQAEDQQPDAKEPAAEKAPAPEKVPVPLPPLPPRRPNPAQPPIEIVLHAAEGSATPHRTCYAFANGGNINVAQPNPTTIVVTMTGLAAARGDNMLKPSSASYDFDLSQCFDLVFHDKDVKTAKLSLEGKVLGRLRSYCECPKPGRKGGVAEICAPAAASISAGDAALVSVELPTKSASGCDSQTVYNHEGPHVVGVSAGKYTLHQTWSFCATAPCGALLKAASADFTPELVLDLRTFGFLEPFVGLANKDFGFTVTIKVLPE